MATTWNRPANKKKFVSDFVSVTQASASVAAKYFISAEGDLQSAIDTYFQCLIENPRPSFEALFSKYADPKNKEQIGVGGIETFCHDIGIEPIDPEILVFAYHCNAKEMGILTREEFDRGVTAMRLKNVSIEDIKQAVQSLQDELKDVEKCKPVYQFLFDFAKDSQKKFIPIEEALAYWSLLLRPHFPIFDEWKVYCETVYFTGRPFQTLWDFATSASSDLSKYDFDGAWPILLDEFVAWYNERYQRKASSTSV